MLLSNRLDTNHLSQRRRRTHEVPSPIRSTSTSRRSASRHAAFGEQRRVAASLDRLSIPTLVVHGGEDRLVPTETSAALEGRAGVTRRVYPGVLHELHNEPAGPQVVKDIVAWIRERVSRMHAPVGS